MENESSEPAVKFGGIESGWCPDTGPDLWNSVGEKIVSSMQISTAFGGKGEAGADGSDGADGAPGPQGPPGPSLEIDVQYLRTELDLTNGVDANKIFPIPTGAANSNAVHFELVWTGSPTPPANPRFITYIDYADASNPIVHFDATIDDTGWQLHGKYIAITITEP